MPDKFDEKTRSKIMSQIRSKNTKIEVILRQGLWKRNLRGFRLHYNLPGKPDIVYTRKKIVIFVDGDFWHGYNWLVLKKIPPKGYWRKKIRKNILRDKKTKSTLGKQGWKVIRIWEHEINKDIGKVIKKIGKLCRA